MSKNDPIIFELIRFFIIPMLILPIMIVLTPVDDYTFGLGCHIHTLFHKEMKCIKEPIDMYGNALSEWVLHNTTKERLDREAADLYNAQLDSSYNEAMKCYNSGKDYNYSLDIKKDYNYTCNQLGYINDHLIDKTRQVDGGYIRGHYSGFLSSGYIEGHFYQYVTEGVLATGQLVKNITYHIDCHNTTYIPAIGQQWGGSRFLTQRDTKNIIYYSESDFVMYYVDNCIRE